LNVFIFLCLCIFFFFQAEDGIRDLIVTGVQTCALPISGSNKSPAPWPLRLFLSSCPFATRSDSWRRRCGRCTTCPTRRTASRCRSEERRVGKECRARRGRGQEKKRERGTEREGAA